MSIAQTFRRELEKSVFKQHDETSGSSYRELAGLLHGNEFEWGTLTVGGNVHRATNDKFAWMICEGMICEGNRKDKPILKAPTTIAVNPMKRSSRNHLLTLSGVLRASAGSPTPASTEAAAKVPRRTSTRLRSGHTRITRGSKTPSAHPNLGQLFVEASQNEGIMLDTFREKLEQMFFQAAPDHFHIFPRVPSWIN